MKHSLLTLLGFFIFLTGYSQTDPLYAQYLSNPLTINPAYSGLNDNFNASISYRRQWAGFEGSPTTINFSAHSAINNNKMGLGLLVVQDNIGNNKNTEANITYAYRLNLKKYTLSFGLQAGILNYRSDNAELNPYDPSEFLFASNQNVIAPNLGAGIILKSESFFLGISIPRMLTSTATYVTMDNPNDEIEGALYNKHIYGTVSYVFFLSERVRFKPSMLVKAVKGAPVSLDINATMNLDEKYSAGIFTRNLNTIGLLTQIKFNEAYRLGYIFEVPTNKSVGTRFTTHEISFGLNIAVFSSHKTSITNF
ncbi:MAG: type IX secretion system membrane protein PorP/SprF [Cyclobacteriaceae bacterium]|nr:type IX secretion system membrane protein PorP/SprF [Cyclobacteriaceae bacterium]